MTEKQKITMKLRHKGSPQKKKRVQCAKSCEGVKIRHLLVHWLYGIVFILWLLCMWGYVDCNWEITINNTFLITKSQKFGNILMQVQVKTRHTETELKMELTTNINPSISLCFLWVCSREEGYVAGQIDRDRQTIQVQMLTSHRSQLTGGFEPSCCDSALLTTYQEHKSSLL